MYGKETLTKVVKALKARVSYWMRQGVENIKPCISAGNRKIGRVMNVSLAPIMEGGNHDKDQVQVHAQ